MIVKLLTPTWTNSYLKNQWWAPRTRNIIGKSSPIWNKKNKIWTRDSSELREGPVSLIRQSYQSLTDSSSTGVSSTPIFILLSIPSTRSSTWSKRTRMRGLISVHIWSLSHSSVWLQTKCRRFLTFIGWTSLDRSVSLTQLMALFKVLSQEKISLLTWACELIKYKYAKMA